MGYKIFINRRAQRVDGNYALARGIGDLELSPQAKIACAFYGQEGYDQEAEIVYFQEGNYLVLACDGLWDVATTQEVGQSIREMEACEMGPREMAFRLGSGAYDSGSGDNISVMVVKL